MMLPRRYGLAGAAMAAALLPTLLPAAERYPERPLRIVVPQAAGSSTDILTRLIAQELGARLGQQAVVDARPGAGGTIGSGIVAKATGDGYTLLMANVSTHAINPGLYANLPYDVEKDFVPISMVATGPYALLVNPALAAASVKELVALAQSRSGQLTYGSGGNGTGTHLAGEMLKLRTGISISHVPYKGSAPGLTDLIGGQIQIMFIGLPPALPMVRTGKVRALAVTGAKRAEVAPELPTMMEAGVPDYAADTWFSLLAPAGTSAATVSRLNRELGSIVKSAMIRQRLAAMGLEAIGSTPRGCGEFMRNEANKWGQVIRASGARVQ